MLKKEKGWRQNHLVIPPLFVILLDNFRSSLSLTGDRAAQFSNGEISTFHWMRIARTWFSNFLRARNKSEVFSFFASRERERKCRRGTQWKKMENIPWTVRPSCHFFISWPARNSIPQKCRSYLICLSTFKLASCVCLLSIVLNRQMNFPPFAALSTFGSRTDDTSD